MKPDVSRVTPQKRRGRAMPFCVTNSSSSSAGKPCTGQGGWDGMPSLRQMMCGSHTTTISSKKSAADARAFMLAHGGRNL